MNHLKNNKLQRRAKRLYTLNSLWHLTIGKHALQRFVCRLTGFSKINYCASSGSTTRSRTSWFFLFKRPVFSAR